MAERAMPIPPSGDLVPAPRGRSYAVASACFPRPHDLGLLWVPARGIQHVDLAVEDVERSLAFYYSVLGPLGLNEKFGARRTGTPKRSSTSSTASRGLGYALRTAVSIGTTRWGSSISPSRWTISRRSTRHTDAASPLAARSSRRPDRTTSKTAKTITRSSRLIPTAFGSRSSAGLPRLTAKHDSATLRVVLLEQRLGAVTHRGAPGEAALMRSYCGTSSVT